MLADNFHSTLNLILVAPRCDTVSEDSGMFLTHKVDRAPIERSLSGRAACSFLDGTSNQELKVTKP